ncbi:MAG: hypothetical protein JW774_05055 [Candidatus Aureabacteria bacterium]|nr:hypothetical protein [Candidatus Auribacterota bacterium]
MPVGNIRTIAISQVENKTGKTIIQESSVANALIAAFNRDATVKVADKELSEAQLFMTLTGYHQQAQSFSQNDVGDSFRLVLSAQVIVKRASSGEVLLDKTIQGEATYQDVSDQPEMERIMLNTAVKKLCTDIVRTVIESGWEGK